MQTCAGDNDEPYPRFISSAQFRALLMTYIDSGWPTKPYSRRSMRQKRSAGKFTYATYGNRTKFRLIGWGPHGRRLIVAP